MKVQRYDRMISRRRNVSHIASQIRALAERMRADSKHLDPFAQVLAADLVAIWARFADLLDARHGLQR
jgi:hypothetical protein